MYMEYLLGYLMSTYTYVHVYVYREGELSTHFSKVPLDEAVGAIKKI